MKKSTEKSTEVEKDYVIYIDNEGMKVERGTKVYVTVSEGSGTTTGGNEGEGSGSTTTPTTP